jgi:hypothetical protein
LATEWKVPAQGMLAAPLGFSVSAPLGLARLDDDELRAADHLGCCPPGEGQQQHTPWVGPLGDELGHSMGEGRGFPRARPCNNQEWSVSVRRRPALCRVELIDLFVHVHGTLIKCSA